MDEVAYIALGSNLGDRDAQLARARAAIADLSGTSLVAASAVEETLPLGGMPQPPYLNQMIAVRTTLTPRALLSALQAIEEAAGRQRSERWGARTLDCDLVAFGDVRSTDPSLTLPHPGIASRDFWRRELAAVRRVVGVR